MAAPDPPPRATTEAALRAALRRVIVLDVSPGDFLPSEDPDWQVLNDAITELVALRATPEADIELTAEQGAELERLLAAGPPLWVRELRGRIDDAGSHVFPDGASAAAWLAAPADARAADYGGVRVRALTEREAAEEQLWQATLAYGAAHEARLAEGRRRRALDYQGIVEEGAAIGALVAEAQAQDALHAAYAAWVGDGAAREGG